MTERFFASTFEAARTVGRVQCWCLSKCTSFLRIEIFVDRIPLSYSGTQFTVEPLNVNTRAPPAAIGGCVEIPGEDLRGRPENCGSVLVAHGLLLSVVGWMPGRYSVGKVLTSA